MKTKINPNDPAFASTKPFDHWGDPHRGMDIRTWLAGLAMRGLCASHEPGQCASLSVDYADALLAALNATPDGIAPVSPAALNATPDGIAPVSPADLPPCPADIVRLPVDCVFVGRGPLKVPAKDQAEEADVFGFEEGKWVPDWEGTAEDVYYALRRGSAIARANGITG